MRKTESRENPQGILCQFMTVFFSLSTNVGKLEYKVSQTSRGAIY